MTKIKNNEKFIINELRYNYKFIQNLEEWKYTTSDTF